MSVPSVPRFEGGATRVGPGSNPLGVALQRIIENLTREGQGRNPQRIAALLGGAGGPKTVVKGRPPEAEAPAPDRPAVPVAAATAEERGVVV